MKLCFFRLYWVISFLFQLSLAVLSLLLAGPFSVARTKGVKWFVLKVECVRGYGYGCVDFLR